MMFPTAASALVKFRKGPSTLKNAKFAFNSYDVDGDGEIDYEGLVGGRGGEYTANEISAVFAMGDTGRLHTTQVLRMQTGLSIKQRGRV